MEVILHHRSAARPRRRRRARRILIIDDLEDAATALALNFEDYNHKVKIALDSKTALRIIRSFKPEIIFADINMPDINGYEFACLVKKDPNGRKAHLVAFTGYGHKEACDRVKHAGFDAHVVKGTPIEKIFALVDAFA